MTRRIIGIDPGGTTGLAIYSDPPYGGLPEKFGGSFQTLHIGPEDHHAYLWNTLCRHINEVDDLIVVCESFEFRQNRQRDNINLMSREYIGVVNLFRQIRNPTSVVFQTAGLAKPFVTDEKLKVMGLYTPGKKHAMDAMRHLVTFMIKNMNRTDMIKPWRSL